LAQQEAINEIISHLLDSITYLQCILFFRLGCCRDKHTKKLGIFNLSQGWIQSLKRGVHFVEKVEDKKKKWRSRVGEGSSNITLKLKYIIIIPIDSFTDKLHCLINTATALLTDCSIRVSRSFMTKVWEGWGGGGHVPPLDPHLRVGTIVDKKVLKQAGVVHNGKSIKTVVSLLCIFWYGKHSRDTTVLIDLL